MQLAPVISLVGKVNEVLTATLPGQTIRFSVFSSASAVRFPIDNSYFAHSFTYFLCLSQVSLIELRELSTSVNLVMRLDDPEPLAMAQMIAADLFIASDTDLSQICAKMREPMDGVVLWPGKDKKKTMPHFMSYDEEKGAVDDEDEFKKAVKERIKEKKG